ncbi:MAG: prepilin-type N-terminal cleavage/methylation domain-containing protein [Smithellaceae bacterium]|nr:prepilin-type N-terminal cleavage/methylation domain-containing protein [Smithellaceae bacterium]
MKKAKREKGFTLIEVVISMFLLGVALLGLAATTVSVVKANDLGKMITTATSAADYKMEELKNSASTAAGFDVLSSGGPEVVDNIYARQWTVVAPATGQFAGMKTVNVTVSWSWRGRRHSVSLDTVVVRPS